MKKWFLSSFCGLVLLLGGCSSAYYGAMEKIGFAKREILVDRVEKTRDAQNEAKQQFASALDHFLAVTNGISKCGTSLMVPRIGVQRRKNFKSSTTTPSTPCVAPCQRPGSVDR